MCLPIPSYSLINKRITLLNQLCQTKINSLYLSFECACFLGQLTSLPRCRRFRLLRWISFPFSDGLFSPKLSWIHRRPLVIPLPQSQVAQQKLWVSSRSPTSPRASGRSLRIQSALHLWPLSAKPHRVNLRSKKPNKNSPLCLWSQVLQKEQYLNKHTNIKHNTIA